MGWWLSAMQRLRLESQENPRPLWLIFINLINSFVVIILFARTNEAWCATVMARFGVGLGLSINQMLKQVSNTVRMSLFMLRSPNQVTFRAN